MFPQRLKEARKNAGLTMDELAVRYNQKFNGGLNKSTLSKYENNRQQPLIEVIGNLADILEVSVDYLMGKTDWKNDEERQAAVTRWKKLPVPKEYSEGGQIENGSKKQTNEKTKEVLEKVLTKLPMYNVPVSAGTGQWLDEGCEYEFSYFEDVPQNADFALRVRGDSMTPMYDDDDIVFIKSNVMVESGQIGIFIVNGEGYLKMLRGNKLISLNDEYRPIEIKEWDSFFCAGRVIGKTNI